ncbi:hypothetical protein DFJ74DRAFT_691000 [Hyaloraphidium curvatum]|nr:hypothetical protein DFJ74DRAFT_691000 [Hyaloraphidium curvatum]
MLKRERTSKKHDEKIRRDAFKAQLNQLVEAIPGMAAYADTRKAIVVHAREYVTQIRDREKRLRAAWMAARRREKACEELLGRKGVGRGEIDAGMPGPAGEEDVARMGEELEELLEGMAPPEVPGRRYEPPRPGIAAAAGYLPLSSASAGGERQGGVSPGASFEAAQNLASLSAPARAPGWTGPGAAAGAGGAYRASPPSQPQPAPPPPGPAGLHSSSGPAAIQSGYASRENSMGTPGWPAYPAAAGTPPGPPGPAGYPRPPQQQQQGGWYYPPGPPPPGQQGQGPPPGWPGRPYYGYPSGPQ